MNCDLRVRRWAISLRTGSPHPSPEVVAPADQADGEACEPQSDLVDVMSLTTTLVSRARMQARGTL